MTEYLLTNISARMSSCTVKTSFRLGWLGLRPGWLADVSDVAGWASYQAWLASQTENLPTI